MDTLSILLDGVEERVAEVRLAQEVYGKSWDFGNASPAGNYWVDDITYTGMLLPYAAEDAFGSVGTGNYTRLRKSEYSVAGDNTWVEYPFPTDSIFWLQGMNVNGTVITSTTYKKNTPFYFAYMNYDWGNDSREVFRAGLGAGSDAEVQLRFFSDGLVEIYKNGIFRGNGNFTKNVEYFDETGAEIAAKGDTKKQMANQIVEAMVIPCRRNELLLRSNHGGGFIFRFNDLDPVNPNLTITGAGQAYWHVPAGQPTAQAAPLKFNTAGTLLSPVFNFRFPPVSGEDAVLQVFYDTPGNALATATPYLMQPDGVTPFSADGNAYQARIRVDMACLDPDALSTPFVYGAQVQYLTVTEFTAGTPGTITAGTPCLVTSAELNVGESPGDVTFRFTIRDPDTVESRTGLSRLDTISNLYCRAKIGSNHIFFGRTLTPSYTDRWNTEAQVLEVEARDYWHVLEKYIFNQRLILDGLRFDIALTDILESAGFGSGFQDVDVIDFDLPTVGGESQGEWAMMCEVGDRASEKLEDLYDTYAKRYVMGWYPGISAPYFLFASTASLGVTPAGTLYASIDDAIAAGYAGSVAYQYVYQTYKQTRLEPEANIVYVVGRDARSMMPIRSTYRDFDSGDPQLAPANRPDNWLGEPREASRIAPYLPTLESVNYSAARLREWVMFPRYMAEWQCQFMQASSGRALWRGDVVKLDGWGKFRINTISARFENEFSGSVDMVWRPTTYTGEYVGQ